MGKQSTFRHWATLAACCGIAASSIGMLTNSAGVFYSPVAAALGVGRGAFALHTSLCTLLAGFLSPVAARLMKKFPIRLLLTIGILFSCGSTALMSVTHSIWGFYVLGLAKGIGFAFCTLMPITTIIGNWFEARRGMATGIALAFSGLGGAIFSPMLTSLIQSVGWEKAYLLSAVISVVLALPGLLTLHYTPEEIGLAPYGGRPRPLRQESGKADKTAPKVNVIGPALWFLCFLTLFNTAITGIAQHFPGISESWGMASQVGAAMISAGMVGNIVSKLLIGVLSDKIGPFAACRTMMCTNLAALTILLLVAPRASAVALAAAFFYGAVYSVSATGLPLLTRRLFGENYASAFSVVTLFTNTGSAFSLTIVGLIYDLTGGYTLALIGGILLDCANLVLLSLLSQREKAASV